MFSRILFPRFEMNAKREVCFHISHIKRRHEDLGLLTRCYKRENINICYSVLVLSFKRSLYKSTVLGCVHVCVCLEQMT